MYILAAISLILIAPDIADAYIRPGSGTDFVQLLISTVVGIGAAIRAFFSKLFKSK